MSFLWLLGEEIHCDVCRVSEKIDYENAPRWIQVGEVNIYYQAELNRLFHGIGNGKSKEAAMYYHVTGVCERCLQGLELNSYYIAAVDDIYQQVLHEYAELKGDFDKQVHDCADSLVKSLQGKQLSEIIKKAVQINITTNLDNTHKSKGQILTERMQYITSALRTRFENYEGKAKLEALLIKQFTDLEIRMQQHLDLIDSNAIVLREYDYYRERNLHPIISYSETVAKPVAALTHTRKFYLVHYDEFTSFKSEVMKYLKNTEKAIKRRIRVSAGNRITQTDQLFEMVDLNMDILLEDNRHYYCQLEGEYTQAIIQCNECGIAYRQIGLTRFERLPAGAMNGVLSTHSRYINCLCAGCYEAVQNRQQQNEYLDIIEQLHRFESEHLINYYDDLKKHYAAYAAEFTEYDLNELRAKYKSRVNLEAPVSIQLTQVKENILKNADSYVRSKTKGTLAIAKDSLSKLQALYSGNRLNITGNYSFYDGEAKLKAVNVGELKYYPFKEFVYKEEYTQLLEIDTTKMREACFDGILSKCDCLN